MEAKKHPKADLERNRGLYFVLGLILTLLLVFLAMEWKTDSTSDYVPVAMNKPDEIIDEPAPVLLLAPPPPPPAPVIIPDVIEIAPDDLDLIETMVASSEPDEKNPPLSIDDIHVEKIDDDPVIPITILEEIPVFPGCEKAKDKMACFQEKMAKHIRKNFHYPDAAQTIGLEGKVYLTFEIQKDGKIGQIRTRGPHKSLEEEGARIIGKLPQMEPGKQQGKPVRVSYSIPIVFQLD